MKRPTTIDAATKACRAAFAKYPDASFAWCCHHEIWAESLTAPAENRIEFILEHKAQSERVVRLNNFRPVRDEAKRTLHADYEAKCFALYADYEPKSKALDADYIAKRKALYADALDADYKAKRKALDADALYADYKAKRKALDADYMAKCKALDEYKKLKKLYKQDVPFGTWNGTTILK